MHDKHKVGLLGVSFALFILLLVSASYIPAIDYSCVSSEANLDTPEPLNMLSIEPGPIAAFDDGYAMDEDTVLVVGAPGVLANDVAADPLTAIIDTNPSSGAVTLNGDGSFEYTPNLDFNGIDSFTYKATDGVDESNIASVVITVNAVNDPPIANEDGYLIYEDQPLDVPAPGVYGNDWDVDGDTLLVDWVTTPSHGLLTFYPDGGFTYLPDANWFGTDFFVYSVTDGIAVSNLATVAIDVIPVNDAPLALDDSAILDEDTSVDIDVLANDADVEGDVLWVLSVTSPAWGAVTINPDGTLTYFPMADYNGPDSFTYAVGDGMGGISTATVSITVIPVNDAPVAHDDEYLIDEDTLLVVGPPGVYGNDNDVDGDSLIVDWVSDPAVGILTFYPDGSFTYMPDENIYGVFTFQYSVTDGEFVSNLATVTIIVNAVNDPPVAVDDFSVLNEEEWVVIPVLANDWDLDGDPLYVVSVGMPLHGTVAINADGTLTYFAEPHYSGTDSFTYTIGDGNGGTDTGVVVITVVPVNDAPVATDDSYSTDEDMALVVGPPGVLENDWDPDGDPLVITLETSPFMGELTLNPDGSFTYVPYADYYGIDFFQYSIFDGELVSSVARVTIIVNSVNDSPTAIEDEPYTDEDTPVVINVLANDCDPDGDPLYVASTTEPSHGMVEINPDGTVTYYPAANYYGSDFFTYTVEDGNGGSDTGAVSITINPVDDPSVAVDDYVTTDEDTPINIDVLANDYDVEGDYFMFFGYGWSPPQPYGQLEIVYVDDVKMIRYTPNPDWYGEAWFVYDIYKVIESGAYVQDRAYVYVTVNPIPDAPEVQDDSYSTLEDTVLYINAAEGVLANDIDVDGDVLQIVLRSTPTSGGLALNADGSFTYTPNPNFWGVDMFTYHVTDGLFESKVATVIVTVLSVNDAPVAVDDTYETDQNIPLLVLAPGVLSNDSDIDNNRLTGVLIESPLNGVVWLSEDGLFEYTPDPGWYGTDTFTYRAFDGTDYSNIATVTITVILVNTPPVALDDAYVTEACGTLIVTVPGILENDFDNEWDPLEAVLVDAPMCGILVLSPDGSFTYTPNTGWYGIDTFMYQAYDGLEYSNVATVTITVVDLTPPVTTIHLAGDEGEYGWYHSDVEVTLSATDDCSGVAETMYSLDGTTWITYTDPFVVSESGEFTIHYYSSDLAGNVEETQTCTIKIGMPTRDFVTGTGWIWDANGGKGHFTFAVKYHRHGGLKGHAFYTFEDDEYAYLLVCSDWIGLAINDNYALMEGKCFLLRYNYETRELECLCHYYFRIEVWDNGRGRHDIFRIRIYDESGVLFHEAGFDPPGELQHGNIKIHDRGPQCCYKGWLKKHNWHHCHW